MESEKTLEMRFQEHVELSDKTHAEIRAMLADQPTKKEFEKMVDGLNLKVDGVVTKVDGVVSIYDFVVKAAHVVSKGSGWSYNFAVGLIAVAAAFALITGGLKAGLAWLVAWALPR